ncbi:MAG: DUF448 domain-containing protein [Mycoplasmatales bacterium]
MTLSRMCVITRRRKLRKTLTKITRIDNFWFVDIEQKLHGRSIYIDLNQETLEKFTKQIKRFKMTPDNQKHVIAKLEEIIE